MAPPTTGPSCTGGPGAADTGGSVLCAGCYQSPTRRTGVLGKPSRDCYHSPLGSWQAPGNNNPSFYLYRNEIYGNQMKGLLFFFSKDRQCKALYRDFICTDQIIYSFWSKKIPIHLAFSFLKWKILEHRARNKKKSCLAQKRHLATSQTLFQKPQPITSWCSWWAGNLPSNAQPSLALEYSAFQDVLPKKEEPLPKRLHPPGSGRALQQISSPTLPLRASLPQSTPRRPPRRLAGGATLVLTCAVIPEGSAICF